MTESRDDQLLAYLSSELTSEERRVFNARIASDPALRCELDAWRSLAQARQRAFNAKGAPERERVLMAQLDALHLEAGSAAPIVAAPIVAASIVADPPDRVDVGACPPGGSQPPCGKLTSGRSMRLLSPLGWALSIVLAVIVVLQSSWIGTAGTPVVAPEASAACFAIRVDLPDALSVSELRSVLLRYSVTVAGGADITGRFTLHARRDSSLKAAAVALNTELPDTIERIDCASVPR